MYSYIHIHMYICLHIYLNRHRAWAVSCRARPVGKGRDANQWCRAARHYSTARGTRCCWCSPPQRLSLSPPSLFIIRYMRALRLMFSDTKLLSRSPLYIKNSLLYLCVQCCWCSPPQNPSLSPPSRMTFYYSTSAGVLLILSDTPPLSQLSSSFCIRVCCYRFRLFRGD